MFYVNLLYNCATTTIKKQAHSVFIITFNVRYRHGTKVHIYIKTSIADALTEITAGASTKTQINWRYQRHKIISVNSYQTTVPNVMYYVHIHTYYQFA